MTGRNHRQQDEQCARHKQIARPAPGHARAESNGGAANGCRCACQKVWREDQFAQAQRGTAHQNGAVHSNVSYLCQPPARSPPSEARASRRSGQPRWPPQGSRPGAGKPRRRESAFPDPASAPATKPTANQNRAKARSISDLNLLESIRESLIPERTAGNRRALALCGECDLDGKSERILTRSERNRFSHEKSTSLQKESARE